MAKKAVIALSTLAATGAGYIAGVLVAPKSGRELRKDIESQGKIAKAKIYTRSEEGRMKIRHAAEGARDKLREMRRRTTHGQEERQPTILAAM